jgi:hypothetical protein
MEGEEWGVVIYRRLSATAEAATRGGRVRQPGVCEGRLDRCQLSDARHPAANRRAARLSSSGP